MEIEDHQLMVRRIAKISLHCIANIACYKAGWDESNSPSKLKNSEDFWVRANGNFLDAATLNWCILFADGDKGKHDWKRAFNNQPHLNQNLHLTLSLSELDFNEKRESIKRYRDKYLAHMDNPSLVFYPTTGFMLSSASYLFELLKSDSLTKNSLGGVYENALSHYEEKYSEANQVLAMYDDYK